jgi:predicted small lipoprotein YifL
MRGALWCCNPNKQMKSKIIILMVFTFFLTSCGRSGALYLPAEPQENIQEKNIQEQGKNQKRDATK